MERFADFPTFIKRCGDVFGFMCIYAEIYEDICLFMGRFVHLCGELIRDLYGDWCIYARIYAEIHAEIYVHSY